LNIVDMHIHSDNSDGIFSVEEIIQKVINSKLAGFCLTDHDTFAGIEKAVSILKESHSDLFFLAGCEFSSYLENVGELHVLAYFSQDTYKGMLDLVRTYQQQRIARAGKIIDCLKNNGMEIDIKNLSGKENAPVGRMHIARELVRLGYYSGTDQAFEKMLRAGSPCYIPRREIKTEDIIHTIKEHSGKAILAHPTILYNVKNWVQLDYLIKEGLDGLEYNHPKISPELSRKIEEKYSDQLILAGGSDFHGDTQKEIIGKFGITIEQALKYFSSYPYN
jgi:3',5'-nucleoside bisphosphate phosphatase